MLAAKIGRVVVLTLLDNRTADVAGAAEQFFELLALVPADGTLQC